MRFGMLTTSFPRFEHDIAGTFVLGFARTLSARGHELEILAPEPREQLTSPRWPGITVRHVPYLRPRALQRTFYGAGVPDNLARDPLAWLGLAPFSLALAAAARSCAPRWHALISHWALPCALAAGLARRGNQPHIAVMHSADLQLLAAMPAKHRLAARIARQADALWFVNPEQQRRFCALLPDRAPPRALVCPMGVDLPPAADAAERAGFRSRHRLQNFTVLALGRLVPIKGLDNAIRAAAGSGMTLVIAGEGPERGRLEALARECGADVRFLGVISGEHKRLWLRAADAFVLPSRQLPSGRSEGLPNALLEAMAHELPVVASHLPGIADLFADPLAEALVPADDPASLRAALLALQSSPARAQRHARAGRLIAERYTWERVGARLEELLGVLPAATSPGVSVT